ncbi:MFS transporter (plasmid) [Rhizobium sp. T1470]|uniref:MFS transporter n=1 Tax=unclassified Rhizobium TaxID=2613769 RepID=UPI001AAEF6B2|nr:MFS transporter [Rhizobium sp. T1473]MCA0806106.1 MFS transporter [Rhizobium sp. T1473]
MERQNSYRCLLKLPGLLPLILAATLSRLAARMFHLTLVLFVLTQTSSPSLAGWLMFAAIVPGLIVSPVAGVLLDRVGPTIAVRIDMIASSFFIAAISFAGWAHLSSPLVLFILVMPFSLAGPLGAAGTRTLLPRLVPPHALDRANALDTAIYAIIDVVGPAIAALVNAWPGPEAAMSMIAATYAGAAICLPRVQRLPGSTSTQTSFLRQIIEGIQIVARQPTLRGLAISYSLYEITWGALYVVVPVFVTNHTAAGSAVNGLLWSAIGIAGGVGALLAGHIHTTGRERHVMAAGMVVTAFAAWPVAAAYGVTGLTIGLMLAGMMSGPISVALLTLRQRRTDPQQLGRVLSISMSLNIAGYPLGAAIAGMVIRESVSATFVLAGIASFLAAIATLSIPSDITLGDRSSVL